MTAGSGLLHIETRPEQLLESGGLFHGFQLWVSPGPSSLRSTGGEHGVVWQWYAAVGGPLCARDRYRVRHPANAYVREIDTSERPFRLRALAVGPYPPWDRR